MGLLTRRCRLIHREVGDRPRRNFFVTVPRGSRGTCDDIRATWVRKNIWTCAVEGFSERLTLVIDGYSLFFLQVLWDSKLWDLFSCSALPSPCWGQNSCFFKKPSQTDRNINRVSSLSRLIARSNFLACCIASAAHPCSQWWIGPSDPSTPAPKTRLFKVFFNLQMLSMKCPMSQIWFDLLRPWDISEGKHSAISILTFSKSLCLRDCRAEDSRTWLKDTFIVGKLSHFHRFSKFSSYLHPRVILLLFIRASIVGKPCLRNCFQEDFKMAVEWTLFCFQPGLAAFSEFAGGILVSCQKPVHIPHIGVMCMSWSSLYHLVPLVQSGLSRICCGQGSWAVSSFAGASGRCRMHRSPPRVTNHDHATRCNKHFECVQQCFLFQKRAESLCQQFAFACHCSFVSNTSNTFINHSRYSSFEKSLLNSADCSCFQLPELSKEATTRTMQMISTATSTVEVPQAGNTYQ